MDLLKKIGLIFSAVLCLTVTVKADVTGDTNPAVNTTRWYEYTSQFGILGEQWEAQGGTVISTTQHSVSGEILYRANISWNSSGNTSVKIKNFQGTVVSSMNVNVLPLLTGGSIGGVESVCTTSSSTSTLSNNLTPSGGTGSYSYQWQRKPPVGSWSNISGATNISYNPGTIDQTYDYRRRVVSGLQTEYSNVSRKTLLTTLNPGVIGANQSICSDQTAATITNNQSATGSYGSFTYLWQQSSGSSPWSAADGDNDNVDYTPPSSLTQTMKYRRRVLSGTCNPVYSNVVRITYFPDIQIGSFSGATDFCQSGTIELAYNGINEDTYIISWERSHDSGITWNPLNNTVGLTGLAFLEPALDAVNGHQYRVKMVNGCETKYTAGQEILVRESTDVGNVAASTSSFWDSGTGYVSVDNHLGDVVGWEIKTSGNSWQPIPSSDNKTSIAFNISQTTDYRVTVQNGPCLQVPSPIVTVEVVPLGMEGYITGEQEIYNNVDSIELTLNDYQGQIDYWMVSETGKFYDTISSTQPTIKYAPFSSGERYFKAAVTYLGATRECTPFEVMSLLDVQTISGSENYVIKEIATVAAADLTAFDALSDSNGDKLKSMAYYDGFGRTIQSVVKNQSAAGNDIVSFQEYDQYGRSLKQYLPYTATGSDFYTGTKTAQASFYNSPPTGVVSDSFPFAETKVEDSPLQRVLEQSAPGADWQLNANTVSYAYDLNGANEIEQLVLDVNNQPAISGYYPSGTVSLTTMTDENGHTVKTYTYRGRTIIKEVEATTGTYNITHNFYDDLGRLHYVVPPEAVNRWSADYENGNKTLFLNKWCFQYTYDTEGRLVEKRVPGAEPQYIIYDNLDRVALTQDGNQRVNKQWLFVKYDRQQRPVYTGVYTETSLSTRAAMQTYYDGLDYDATDDYYEITEVNATYHGYSNNVFPTSNTTLLSVSYYDDYDFDRNGTADYDYQSNQLEGQEAEAYAYTRGIATGSKVNIVGTTDWLTSVQFYDDRGRVTQTQSENHLGQLDISTVVYDYAGKVLTTKAIQHNVITEQDMAYDHAGRLTSIAHKSNKLVQWESSTNISLTDEGWKKTSGGNSYNAGAVSSQTIAGQHSGSLVFTVAVSNTKRYIGLNDANTSSSWNEIDYGFLFLESGSVQIRENGSSSIASYSYQPGDQFRIERVDGTVSYWQNGVLLREILGATNSSLTPDISIHTIGHVLENLYLVHDEVNIANYTYNELGQLLTKNIHDQGAEDYLQTSDYSYNIRGWLKSLNDPDNITSDQLFGMELLYNESATGYTASYNGNISGMKWKNNLTSTSKVEAYAYTYDDADRLTEAKYGEGSTFLDKGFFALENIGYDKNGNINGLDRKTTQTGLTATLMDDMTMTYDGNAMSKADDSAIASGFENLSTATTEYTYDANGNMISDANKEITSIGYNVLNKPDTITFDDGAKLVNTYAANGIRLTQELYLADTVNKRTDYIGSSIYENDTLQFFSHPEGRVVANSDGSLEYQYAHTDHLGNVRMLYTSETDSIEFVATMEADVVDQLDDAFFTGIDNTRMTDPRSGQGSNEVSHLYATQPIGPGLTVPFYPGDTIEISVKAFHLGGDFSTTTTMAALASALASTFTGITNVGTEQELSTAFDDAYGNTIIGDGTSTRPSAYLNFLFFDQQMNYVPSLSGYQQVSESGNEETLSTIKVATEAGYLFTYVSNESGSTGNEVYFDDFEVKVKESMVVQNTDYYPFGLQHSTSWTRISDLKNNFLYNAGSELNEKTKNYETYYRDYDPALGRFNQIDPLSSSFSNWTPYNYAFNDPVYWNDPYGDSVFENWGQVIDFIQSAFQALEHVEHGGYGWNSTEGTTGAYGYQQSMEVAHDYAMEHYGQSPYKMKPVGHVTNFKLQPFPNEARQSNFSQFMDGIFNGAENLANGIGQALDDPDTALDGFDAFMDQVFEDPTVVLDALENDVKRKFNAALDDPTSAGELAFDIIAIIMTEGTLRNMGIPAKKVGRVFTQTAREGDLLFYSTKIGDDLIEFGGNFSKSNGTLTIRNFDIDGALTNKLGIRGIKDVVTDFGRQQGVNEVIIHGAKRTTGARPGRFPSKLVFKIN